jgi:AcrR family transcriptional regulator
MPPLWTKTIEGHRSEVREAVLDAAAALAAQHGLRAVTMSDVAKAAGIGRATLYKYFPSVEAILLAWHERQVAHHFTHLQAVAASEPVAVEKLKRVLEAFGMIASQHHGSELAGFLHAGPHMTHARRHLAAFLTDLAAAGAEAGDLRGDVAPSEQAAYCLHAIEAAATAPSKAAVMRLVEIILAGLKPIA